jgi:hypothetical protein
LIDKGYNNGHFDFECKEGPGTSLCHTELKASAIVTNTKTTSYSFKNEVGCTGIFRNSNKPATGFNWIFLHNPKRDHRQPIPGIKHGKHASRKNSPSFINQQKPNPDFIDDGSGSRLAGSFVLIPTRMIAQTPAADIPIYWEAAGRQPQISQSKKESLNNKNHRAGQEIKVTGFKRTKVWK